MRLSVMYLFSTWAVVDALGAIDDGAALHRETADILRDARVGADEARRHLERELDAVAARPRPGDRRVALVERNRDGLAVDRERHLVERGGVDLFVELRGHARAARPAGDAHLDGERARRAGIDLKCESVPAPRIAVVRLAHLHVAALEAERGVACHEEIPVERVALGGVGVGAELRDDAHHVGGAAGAAVPAPARDVSARGEGIDVEERVAADGDARREVVVEDALEDVDVLRVAVKAEHAELPERVGEGCARLQVSFLVGQLEVGAELLAGVVRAHAARDVHLAADHVLPDGVERGTERLVAREREHLGHARVEVAGAHGVAHGLALFADGLVVLVVGGVEGGTGRAVERTQIGTAAPVDEVFDQLHRGRFVREAPELGQGDLGRLVSGDAFQLAASVAERARDQVHVAPHHVHQVVLAGELLVGEGRLHELAHAVELVAVLQVAPARRAGPPAFPAHAVDRVGGVEVAVRLLRGGDDRDDGLGARLEVGIGMREAGEERALQDAVEVGILEGVAVVGDAELARGRVAEVVEAPRLLVAVERGGDRDEAVRLHARAPEGVRHAHVRYGGDVDGEVGGRRHQRHRQNRGAQVNCFHVFAPVSG